MVFFADLLIAFLVAVLFIALFGIGYRREGVGAGLLWLFVIIFLATWAGGLWLTPLGPPLFGVSWLSFLLAGLFFTLLIMALLPPPTSRPGVSGEVETDAGTFFAVNLFFWVLLIGFFVAIVLSYLL